MTSPGTGGSDARAQARASADAAATDGFELPGAPDAFERFWNAHRMAVSYTHLTLPTNREV